MLNLLKKYLFIFMIFISGKAMSSDFYKKENYFPPKYLELITLIKENKVEESKNLILKNKLDINQEFKVSLNVELEEFSILTKLMTKIVMATLGDGTIIPKNKTTPAPDNVYYHETITLLKYFILTNDLESLRRILELGANPEQTGSWHGNAYLFTIKMNKPEALDKILEFKPHQKMIESEKTYWLNSFFKSEKKSLFFSSDEYELTNLKLLEVALKHKVDFNLEIPSLAYRYLILDLSPNGLEKVVWLINNNYDPNLINQYGETLPLLLFELLEKKQKMKQKDDSYFEKIILIKNLLEKKGVLFPPTTREINIEKRSSQGLPVSTKKINLLKNKSH